MTKSIGINSGEGNTVGVNRPGSPGIGVNRKDLNMYVLGAAGKFISVPQALNLTYTSPQSYEIWFKLHTVAGGVKVLFSIYSSALTKGVLIRLSSGNPGMSFFMDGGVGQRLRTTASSSLPFSEQRFVAGIWYHVVYTYDGVNAAGVKCYVDGQIVSNVVIDDTLANSPVNSTNVKIGGDVAMSASVARIFSKVLTAEEVRLLYNNGQPLLNANISNKVWEIVLNDSFSGSQYIVKESVSGVTGTANVVEGSLQSADMNMNRRVGNQHYTGNSITYRTYGLSGEAPTDTTITDSPYTDVRRAIYYHAANNKTYIVWHQRPYLGGNRQGMVMEIDHTNKYCSPSYPIGYLSPGGYDTHGQPACIMTNEGELLILQEDQHGSPIYCRKTTNLDISNVSQISVTVEKGAYPAPYKAANGDIYMLTRAGGEEFNGLMKDYLSKSIDNGVTWSRYQVLYTFNTGTDRAYFDLIWHPSKLIILTRVRDEIEGKYFDIHYEESDDCVTFYNADRSFSKNVITEGAITRQEMFDHCTVRRSIDESEDVVIKGAIALDEGLVGWGNKGTDQYVTVWWNGISWQEKPCNLPNFIPAASVGNTGRGDRWWGHKHSATHYTLWRVELRGGFDVVVEYETFDFFDTFNGGTVISPSDKNHQQLVSTWNRDAAILVLSANQLTGDAYGNTYIWFYEYSTV